MLSPNTVLQNRYRVVRQLGQGGMGTVYEAVDERLGAAVALKETLFSDDTLRKQFEREARLLARLHHPALPNVRDHFVEGDGQFLVMQFIEGEDLDAMRRRRGGWLPPDDVLKWADQLLDALDYLHSQDPPVIHRDIKPQNLKLTARGQIILLDFGLAKGFTGAATNVTVVKSFFGFTRMYAPLEQIQGAGTDPRSDLYSLGITLYQLLTGVTPPDAISRVTATTEGDDDPLLPASRLNGQVPPEVSEVLSRAMMVSRHKRFAGAAEMRTALSRASAASGAPPAGDFEPTVVDPPADQGPASKRQQWDEYSFFEEAGKRLKPNDLESVQRLYDFSVGHARVSWGTGVTKGTFNAKFDHINNRSLYSVFTNGDLGLNFAWLADTQAGVEAVKRLGPRLRQLPGFNIPSDYAGRYLTVPPARWVNQADAFMKIIKDVVLPDSGDAGGADEEERTLIALPMRIDEPVVAININKGYPKAKTASDLYNITRGTWRINRQRAASAKYVFAVYKGVVREVYKIDAWRPASRELYEFFARLGGSTPGDLPPDFDDGRSEFIGELAPEDIRNKYVGRQLPERFFQFPIRYFNC